VLRLLRAAAVRIWALAPCAYACVPVVNACTKSQVKTGAGKRRTHRDGPRLPESVHPVRRLVLNRRLEGL
jgi:hypothetical protein